MVEAAHAEDAEAGDADADTQADGDVVAEAPTIDIEVTVTDLTEEQKARFGNLQTTFLIHQY